MFRRRATGSTFPCDSGPIRMTEPTILAVILNDRAPELTLKAASAALRDMADIRGEIVIVDDASQEDSFDVITRAVADRSWNVDGRVRALQASDACGFAAGNNAAICVGLSSGHEADFVYLLNSDAWPEAGAIRRLRDFLIAHPKTGVAGSAARGVDGMPLSTAFRFPSVLGEFEGAARMPVMSRLLAHFSPTSPPPHHYQNVDWVAGASMMIRQSMLNTIGIFDPRFALQFAEIDLCRRAKAAGWQTHLVANSEIIFFGPAIGGMTMWRRTPERWFDARLRYFTKTHGQVYAALATLARISGCAIWRLRRLVTDKPQGDPVGFLGDLIAHSMRAAFSRSTQHAGGAASEPFAKDTK